MQRHLRFRQFGVGHARVLLGLIMLGVFVRVASAAPAEAGVDCAMLSFLLG